MTANNWDSKNFSAKKSVIYEEQIHSRFTFKFENPSSSRIFEKNAKVQISWTQEGVKNTRMQDFKTRKLEFEHFPNWQKDTVKKI